MAQTKDNLALLQKLSELDAGKRRMADDASGLAAAALQIEAIRKRMPTALLTHYDLRRSRGKAAVAPARGNVCGGCHLALPSGLAAELRRDGPGLHICSNCGVFLFFVATPAEPVPPVAVPPVKVRRSRKVAVKSA